MVTLLDLGGVEACTIRSAVRRVALSVATGHGEILHEVVEAAQGLERREEVGRGLLDSHRFGQRPGREAGGRSGRW